MHGDCKRHREDAEPMGIVMEEAEPIPTSQRIRLREYKIRYMAKLVLLNTSNEHENRLREIVLEKLRRLRSVTVPELVQTLYVVIDSESAGQEFKELCKQMIDELPKLGYEIDDF